MTGQVLVYDTSAIIALFQARHPAYGYWQRADRGLLHIAFPALAVVAASRDQHITPGGWERILLAPTVAVLPLSETVAVEIGTWSGEWWPATCCGRRCTPAGLW